MAFRLYRVLPDTHALDINVSFRRTQDTAHDIHRGRLARAVGTQQAINTVLGNLEINIPYRPLDRVTMG